MQNRGNLYSDSARIAKDADIIGNVYLGKQVSVWYHAVLRGDVMEIIEKFSSFQNVYEDAILFLSEKEEKKT